MEMRADKETIVLLASLLILTSIFSVSLYSYLNPPKRVWEGRIFECIPKAGHTYISGYGGDYLRLVGNYELEVGATYRITYITRKQNWAEKIISIEKIEG